MTDEELIRLAVERGRAYLAESGLHDLRSGGVFSHEALLEIATLDPGDVELVHKRWLEERWLKERTRARHPEALLDSIFWSTAHDQEFEEGIARYRFRERHFPDEFDPAFEQVELLTAQALLESPTWAAAAYHGYLVTQSPQLVEQLFPLLRLWLREIEQWFDRDGYLQDTLVTEPRAANVHWTAEYLAAVRRAGLGSGARWESDADAWLQSVQHPDGYWTRLHFHRSGPTPAFFERYPRERDGHLFATAAAVTALALGESPPSLSLRRAARWIAQQQRPDGSWEQLSTRWPLSIVWSLEALEFVVETRPAPRAWEQIAREFAAASRRALLDPRPASADTAVAMATHAVEMRLYDILEKNRRTTRRKSGMTIGTREALEECRQLSPEVDRASADIRELVLLRDGSLHRGQRVDPQTARHRITSALRGVDLWSD